MMKSLFTIAALFCFSTSLAGAEEIRVEPKAVFELFTSQGCSSCPPADALLSEYGARDDIIALAYHVDYWDYIGWKDTFGRPQSAELQRAYAKSWNTSRIYTPQLVINGKSEVVGSRRGEVDAGLNDAALSLPVQLSTNAGMLEVDIPPADRKGEAAVWLVTYKSSADVKIERGENTGKSITYSHIVTGRQILGMWEPQKGAHIKLPLEELMKSSSDGAAIVVQEDKSGLPGPIIGAAAYTK